MYYETTRTNMSAVFGEETEQRPQQNCGDMTTTRKGLVLTLHLPTDESTEFFDPLVTENYGLEIMNPIPIELWN